MCGPLRIDGDGVDPEEEIWVPLATTEGALLASVNRGCRAIVAAGGASVRVEDVGMTRAPAFRTSGVQQTREFLDWIEEHDAEIRALAEEDSRYLRLAEIKPQAFGTSVYLRFRFESGDAMGMNMATIACDRIVRDLIEPATGVACVALSGNYCVDKKPSAVNFLEGRGKRIHAEVVLEGEISPTETRKEGPFGEFMGMYVPVGDNVVFEVLDVAWRDGAMFHSLTCGSPEDMWPLELSIAARIYGQIVNQLPGIIDVSCHPTLVNTVVKIRKEYEGHPRHVALAAIGAHLGDRPLGSRALLRRPGPPPHRRP